MGSPSPKAGAPRKLQKKRDVPSATHAWRRLRLEPLRRRADGSGLMLRFDLTTRRDTLALGRRIARVLEPGALVVLSGPLGSGKTFLTRAVCRALGLPPSVRVPSPTFTLVHEHPTDPPVSHADLY